MSSQIHLYYSLYLILQIFEYRFFYSSIQRLVLRNRIKRQFFMKLRGDAHVETALICFSGSVPFSAHTSR